MAIKWYEEKNIMNNPEVGIINENLNDRLNNCKLLTETEADKKAKEEADKKAKEESGKLKRFNDYKKRLKEYDLQRKYDVFKTMLKEKAVEDLKRMRDQQFWPDGLTKYWNQYPILKDIAFPHKGKGEKIFKVGEKFFEIIEIEGFLELVFSPILERADKKLIETVKPQVIT